MSVPLLTLDENTLLCWTLGDSKKRKLSDVVNKWAVAIPGDAKPPALNHVTVSPIREHKSKKARREALPNHVTPKWFRYTFVSTYIDFVGQTANPWKVPGKAVEVMQRIWDATCACEYRITASTAVYQKVCVTSSESALDTTLISIFFRRFNTAQSRGGMLSGLSASHPLLPISTPKSSRMENDKNSV
jgi:hypothetical protein